MSKFWGGDSGSESESESSDDEPILNQRAPQTSGRFGANYDESDSGIISAIYLCSTNSNNNFY